MAAELLDFLRSFLTPERLGRMEEVLAERTRRVTVVLENMHRTQNASACLRTAEAFGVQDVHIIPGKTDFRVNRDIAQGAARWLTVRQYQSEDENGALRCFQELREAGYRIVVVSGRDASGPLAECEPRTKTALVFGNEFEGVSDIALAHADEVRSLPLFGFTESFNLSIAVGLSLAEILPKVRRAEIPWNLTATEKQTLREEWIRRSLGHRLPEIEREFHRRRSEE